MLSNSTTQDSVALATCLRAVSDPARLRLLRLCADRPTSVSELSLATGESEPNVSRQLKQLATAGLLQRVRRGQRVEYLPNDMCRVSLSIVLNQELTQLLASQPHGIFIVKPESLKNAYQEFLEKKLAFLAK